MACATMPSSGSQSLVRFPLLKQMNAPVQRTRGALALSAPQEARPPSFVRIKGLTHGSGVSLSPRERRVLEAALALPCEGLTPSAAMAALVRQGLDLSPSTISYTLVCLERKGVLRLARKRERAEAKDAGG